MNLILPMTALASVKLDLSVTLKKEYFGVPEKDCRRDLGAKTLFWRTENNIYFPNFLHVITSHTYDLKFDIKFSSHGHSKTYWVFVLFSLLVTLCVSLQTQMHMAAFKGFRLNLKP